MYKPGDRIRIREDCNFYPWYNKEVFIVEIYTGHHVTLDRKLSEEYSNLVSTDYIIHEYLYERKDKLLKLKERINENR